MWADDREGVSGRAGVETIWGEGSAVGVQGKHRQTSLLGLNGGEKHTVPGVSHRVRED